jgi:hypothetical protein
VPDQQKVEHQLTNYCDSNIIVTGPRLELARFQQTCFVKDSYGQVNFSLESFVPEPKVLCEPEPAFDSDLALIALGVDPEPIHPFVLTLERVLGFDWAKEAGISSRADLLAHIEKRSPEGVAAARRRLVAFAETGFYDWRHWREANWGTMRAPEWTAILINEPERLVFCFSTAWSFPAPAFRVLGVLFPNLAFDIAGLDREAHWAVTGLVKGTSMSLRSAPDYEAVYVRVVGERNDEIDMEEEEPERVCPWLQRLEVGSVS